VVVDFGSNAYLGDGDWHHVVGTYADQVITLYVDGVSRGSNNLGADMNIPAASQFRVGNFSSTDANHKFAGDIDEIQILHGAWTAEEVAAEYAAKRPAADASLPAPIARWTFDELVDEGGMKLFKDAGPNGWDLVNTPSNGVYVANPAMTYPEDFGGRYAALPATAGPYLRLKSGVTMTDALPQGSSFTVSARVRYPVNGVVLIFGDGTDAGSYRLSYSGCPRNIVAYVGANTCALYETSMYGIGGDGRRLAACHGDLQCPSQNRAHVLGRCADERSDGSNSHDQSDGPRVRRKDTPRPRTDHLQWFHPCEYR